MIKLFFFKWKTQNDKESEIFYIFLCNFTCIFLSINNYISSELYTNYNLCIYYNLQIGCKFTNDKGTLRWSHTEPLMDILDIWISWYIFEIFWSRFFPQNMFTQTFWSRYSNNKIVTTLILTVTLKSSFVHHEKFSEDFSVIIGTNNTCRHFSITIIKSFKASIGSCIG